MFRPQCYSRLFEFLERWRIFRTVIRRMSGSSRVDSARRGLLFTDTSGYTSRHYNLNNLHPPAIFITLFNSLSI